MNRQIFFIILLNNETSFMILQIVVSVLIKMLKLLRIDPSALSMYEKNYVYVYFLLIDEKQWNVFSH